jgi:hypothetical protein
LIVLRRTVQGRARLTNSDRWFFIRDKPASSPYLRCLNFKPYENRKVHGRLTGVSIDVAYH